MCCQFTEEATEAQWEDWTGFPSLGLLPVLTFSGSLILPSINSFSDLLPTTHPYVRDPATYSMCVISLHPNRIVEYDCYDPFYRRGNKGSEGHIHSLDQSALFLGHLLPCSGETDVLWSD